MKYNYENFKKYLEEKKSDLSDSEYKALKSFAITKVASPTRLFTTLNLIIKN